MALAVVVALASAGATVACSPAPADPPPLPDRMAQVISEIPADIGPDQRAVIDDVLATGSITYDQYAASVYATLDCAERGGLRIDGPYQVTSQGLPALTWGWGAPGDDGSATDPTLAIGEACRMEHSFWVEQVYFNQPQALESEREQLEQFREPLVQCLADHGVTVDPDADIYDIIQKAVDLASVNDFTGPDCNDEVGVAASL